MLLRARAMALLHSSQARRFEFTRGLFVSALLFADLLRHGPWAMRRAIGQAFVFDDVEVVAVRIGERFAECFDPSAGGVNFGRLCGRARVARVRHCERARPAGTTARGS